MNYLSRRFTSFFIKCHHILKVTNLNFALEIIGKCSFSSSEQKSAKWKEKSANGRKIMTNGSKKVPMEGKTWQMEVKRCQLVEKSCHPLNGTKNMLIGNKIIPIGKNITSPKVLFRKWAPFIPIWVSSLFSRKNRRLSSGKQEGCYVTDLDPIFTSLATSTCLVEPSKWSKWLFLDMGTVLILCGIFPI